MVLSKNYLLSIQPNVVIVLATYNPNLNFLNQQIQSILSQEFQNWTCLIVDDASPIATYQKMLKDLSALISDPRFSIHRYENNVGACSNFSRGLILAREKFPTAKYIALSDQDDNWKSHKLKRLVEYLEKNQSTALVHSDSEVIDENNHLIAPSVWKLENRRVQSVKPIGLIFHNKVAGASCLLKAELVDLACPIPEQNLYYQDVWLALQAWRLGTVDSLSEVLQGYRSHRFNVVGVKKKSQNWGLNFYIQKAKNHLSRCETLSQHFLNSFPADTLHTSQNFHKELQDQLRIFEKNTSYFQRIQIGLKYLSQWTIQELILFIIILILTRKRSA